ncbi:MAG TPA: FAD-dependent oxidoreductase, partial [Gaiellales bacterium]|nr:FAD-dependent oxidoreductase [Gaiellales bacterium]
MRFLILGSGPAGYAAASTAAALGAEVTIVDRMALGGNWTMTDGIPSKTLLQVASSMAEIERAEQRGLVFEHGRPRVDLLRAEAHARFIGQHQSRGVRERLDLIEATIVYGQGAVESDGVLVVTTERGPRTLEYDHLLVCTGAAPWEPPFAQVDHQRVLNTRDVLGLLALPEQLLVVGAGATGCEFAEFFQSCGSRVTLLSSRPQ